MSANLTFSGTAGAAYSVPASHALYGNSLTYNTSTTIRASGGDAYSQLVDSEVCSGECSVGGSFTYGAGSNSSGFCYINSSGTGFNLVATGTTLKLVKLVAFSDGATISQLTGQSNTGTDNFLVTFNTSTGSIDVIRNGSSVLTGTYTDTLTGLRAGFTTYGGYGGYASIASLDTVTSTPSSVTIDSYPTTVRSGSSGNAYTTTGLTSVTAISIGSLAATGISDTSGDGTHSVPALTDGVAHEMYGTRTVTVTGAEGSPTISTSFQPATGNSFVTLSGTLNTTDTGGLYNFSPAAVVTDQIVFPGSGITYDAQGNITGEAGVYNCWHIQASTKIARSYTVTLGSPASSSTQTKASIIIGIGI